MKCFKLSPKLLVNMGNQQPIPGDIGTECYIGEFKEWLLHFLQLQVNFSIPFSPTHVFLHSTPLSIYTLLPRPPVPHSLSPPTVYHSPHLTPNPPFSFYPPSFSCPLSPSIHILHPASLFTIVPSQSGTLFSPFHFKPLLLSSPIC